MSFAIRWETRDETQRGWIRRGGWATGPMEFQTHIAAELHLREFGLSYKEDAKASLNFMIRPYPKPEEVWAWEKSARPKIAQKAEFRRWVITLPIQLYQKLHTISQREHLTIMQVIISILEKGTEDV